MTTVSFEGRCAIVTGGAHGIGRALAERLSAEGARIVVADVNVERAKKVAARVDGLAVRADVGDREAVHELVRLAETTFGPVDIFCSNAGIQDLGDGLRSTPDQVEQVVAVNLLAHVWAAQAVVDGMVDRGRGFLVQTISSAALVVGTNMGYTMTKHGALGFAEWLALNYAHRGIRVTCLCPNAVNTGMLGRDEGGNGNQAPSEPRQDLGEIVEPELCAEMTLEAMRNGRFLVLPHPRVGESFLRKAGDYERWLEGTNRRLRRRRGEDVP
jgi:NAD(P)-dependent dehydrogenase (short-subunit alcohol dehydrogenase family)